MPEGSVRSQSAALDLQRERQEKALLELARLLGRSAARDGLVRSSEMQSDTTTLPKPTTESD